MIQSILHFPIPLFFQLKELEKLGPKKGVISQSVKDVVQSLVDDDLVFKDKIGTSVSDIWIVLQQHYPFNPLLLNRKLVIYVLYA